MFYLNIQSQPNIETRGLHGPISHHGPRGPRWEMNILMGRGGPANERWFFQRAGLGWQMKGDFFQRSDRQKKKWVLNRTKNIARQSGLTNLLLIIIIIITEYVSQSSSSLLFSQLLVTHTFWDNFEYLYLDRT